MISAQMQAATSVAVFVCTLGKAISDWSQDLHTKGDSIKGYLVDVLASVTIEKAVDSIHDQLEKKMADRKLGVTNRYSPGYCDWPVSDQHDLFSLLPEDFCGIRLTESAMMVPVKSVSGIIGIGPGVERVDYQCKNCQQSSRCDWGKK
jgi:cobalamin-dependent methionine synthase I